MRRKHKNKKTELGVMLAKGRASAGLTQREVAVKLGYTSAQHISNFERGRLPPNTKKLAKLVRIYKLDPQEVISTLLKERSAELKRRLSQAL
jgi:transcriptional regulator with XRE-family HTH domain